MATILAGREGRVRLDKPLISQDYLKSESECDEQEATRYKIQGEEGKVKDQRT